MYKQVYDRGYYVMRTLWLMFHTTIFIIRWATTIVFPKIRPRLLRLYCEYSGATFIKFGQLMAMRQDIFSQPYIDELSKLLDEVPPESPEVIQSILKRNYGDKLYTNFKFIDVNPLGCGSIAQVHSGILADGTKVAIKVKRRKIDRRFRIDLFNLQLIGRVLDILTITGSRGISDFINELARIMVNELDFDREAKHMKLMHDLMEEDPVNHYVPEVYTDLCTRNIIVMEQIEGIRMTQFVHAVKNNRTEFLDMLAERGIEPKDVARTMFFSVLEQVFHHRVFHADPHAGNVMVMDGGKIAYIDFGIVAHMDSEMWRKQWALFHAVSKEDVHATYQAIVDVMSPLPPRSMIKVQVELKERVWQWIVAAKTGSTILKEKSSSRLIFDCAYIGRKYNLHLPWRFLVSHRATLLSDAIVFTLDPAIDSLTNLRTFFRNEIQESKLGLWTPEQIATTINEAMEVVLTLPAFINEARQWMQQGIPEVLRDYSEGVTTIDTFVRLGLLYFRRFLFMITGTIVLVHFTKFGFKFDLEKFPSWIMGQGWWLGIIVTLVFIIFLTRVLDATNRKEG